MTYDSTRENEQLRYLEPDIADFVRRYRSKPRRARRRTLFLFPGGMGSRLLRARAAYRDHGGPSQMFDFDEIWLNTFTFLGAALSLKMRRVGNAYRDSADRIIIPHGSVEWFGVDPYDRFIQWCDDDFDWFVFGWDWRRRPEDTVDFFVKRFLPVFQASVQRQTGNDPLRNFVLIGHSFGGIVVDLIMQESSTILHTLSRGVTVATPFYGYDGQIHRWFKGEPYLNFLGTRRVIEAITSMPGCYVLPYLDSATFALHRAALAADACFPLGAYPCRDAVAHTDVDPFNPGPNRYPTTTGFSLAELHIGLQTYTKIRNGPSRGMRSKFFNIRGVHTRPDDTVGSVTWQRLMGVFHPGRSPVAVGPDVPGDGTQPAWSARLATLPAGQWRVVGGEIDHMFIMEDDETHRQLATVL